MPKNNEIEQLVNGQVADANIVNQIVLNAGNEGGSIPYSESDHQRDAIGSESLGKTAYPWGSLVVSRDKYLMEIETVSNTVASQVLFSELRKIINMKDISPNSYVGQGEKFLRVRTDEFGIEFITLGNNYINGITYIEASADTQRVTTSGSYVKLKEFSPVQRAGNVTVTWEMTSNNVGGTAFARVYIDGIAVGSQKSRPGTGYVTQTESNIPVEVGDVIQIYGFHTGTGNCDVKDAKIKCLNPTIPTEVTGF